MMKRILAGFLCLCLVIAGFATFFLFGPSALAATEVPVPAGTWTSETVTIAVTQEFSGNGRTWRRLPAGQTILDISRMIPAANATNPNRLFIRDRAASGNPAGPATFFYLPPRPAPPLASQAVFYGRALGGYGEITFFAQSTQNLEFQRPGDPWQAITYVPVVGDVWPANPGATVTRISFREAPVPGTSFGSISRILRVPAHRAAPRAVYNPNTDRITGVNAQMEFSLDGGATWTRVVGNHIPRDGANGFGAAPTVIVRMVATATAPISFPITIVPLGSPAGAPTTPFIQFTTETIQGVTPAMEWSHNATRWAPITGTSLDISNLIVSANQIGRPIYIRYSAVPGVSSASQAVRILIPRRSPTPTTSEAFFDGLSNLVRIELTDATEWSADRITWTPIVGNTLVPPGAPAIYVRRAACDINGIFRSNNRFIGIGTQRAAPTAPRYCSETDRIIGVNNQMEFTTDGVTWRPVVGNFIPRDNLFGFVGPGTVEVRYRATERLMESLIGTPIIIPGAPPLAPVGGIEICFETEQLLVGAGAPMQWSTNGIRWTDIDITVTTVDISGQIPAWNARNSVDILVRYAPVAGTAAGSVPFTVTIPRRPAPPTAPNTRFYGVEEHVAMTSAMEWSFDRTTWTPAPPTELDVTWNPITREPSVMGTPASRIYVRVAAVPGAGGSFASTIQTVTIPNRRDMPSARFLPDPPTDTNRSVAGVNNQMEFSIDGGLTWRNVTGSTISSAQLGFDEILAGDLLVRFRATAAAAVSGSWVSPVNVPAVPVPAAPTTPVIDLAGGNRRVTGVTTAMEFSLDGGTTWGNVSGTTITSAQLGFGSIAAGDLLFRYRATANAPESPPWSSPIIIPAVPVPAAPTTPVVESVYPVRRVTGVTTAMEFSVNGGTNWTNVTGTTINSAQLGFGAIGANQLHIRFRQTATNPPSGSWIYAGTLPSVATPAAPTTPEFNPANRTFTGVSALMEFSRDGGLTWTNCTGANITSVQLRIHEIPANQLHIRFRATESAPHSTSWIFTGVVPAVPAPAAPTTPSVNAVNRAITGVNNQMEWSRDNGATWINVTGNQITSAQLGAAAIPVGNLHIRFRETTSAPASLSWISIIAIPAS